MSRRAAPAAPTGGPLRPVLPDPAAPRRPRGGFTLVEVLVALVVLQVGLLGVVATLLVASRTLARAERLEWAVAEAQRAADSLTASGATGGAGRAASGPGELSWRVEAGGRFVVEWAEADSVLVRVEGAAPPWGGGGG